MKSKSVTSQLFFIIILSALLISCAKISTPEDEARRVDAGAALFNSKGCKSCHSLKRAFDGDSISIDEFLRKRGPDLWYAGSKFRPGFVESWLEDPRPIRPLRFNSLEVVNQDTHIRLTSEESALVAAFLMSLTLSPGDRAEPITPSVSSRGRVLFNTTFSCYGCHLVESEGALVGGLSGPSLAKAGERLEADWIYAWLTGPGDFVAKSPMPVYSSLVEDAAMRDLAAYVATFK